MSELRLEHVSKRFGRNLVLDRVNLDIRDGELMVILGPSGCGKSTLLSIVAGIEDLDSGIICLNGQSIGHLPPRNRDMAMVFQNHALYPHMNVYENIAFGLRMHKVSAEEIRTRVNEVAVMLEIEHLLKRKPRQMSGGERQRVAMGRAIARHPQIFLLDEPLSSLDAQLRTEIRTEIKKLHAKLGITMVFVTHDQFEAMTLSDRIAIMDRGRIVQVGTPDEVYHHPMTTFVATFLGNPSMNLISARYDASTCSLHLAHDGGTVLPTKSTPPLPACLIGFRPEHVRLEEQGDLVLDGSVDVLEPTGSDAFALIDCHGLAVKARCSNGELSVGRRIRLAIASEHLHVFDAASGNRV